MIPNDIPQSQNIEVKTMSCADIPTAVRSSFEADRNVDLVRYFEDTPDAGNPIFWEHREKTIFYLIYGNAVRRHRALTVNGGQANCNIVPAKEVPDVIDRLVDYVIRCVRRFHSNEQRKRMQEFGTKVSAAIRSNFGDTVTEMVEIHGLATSPAKQGHGYGSALVNTVTSRANAQHRATWLITSDAYRFYETVGFSIIAEFEVGDGNSTWNKPPIVVRVMLKEPMRPEQ